MPQSQSGGEAARGWAWTTRRQAVPEHSQPRPQCCAGTTMQVPMARAQSPGEWILTLTLSPGLAGPAPAAVDPRPITTQAD